MIKSENEAIKWKNEAIEKQNKSKLSWVSYQIGKPNLDVTGHHNRIEY